MEKIDFERFLNRRIKKMLENAIPAMTKKVTNFGLTLFNGTSEVSLQIYRNYIILLYIELNM